MAEHTEGVTGWNRTNNKEMAGVNVALWLLSLDLAAFVANGIKSVMQQLKISTVCVCILIKVAIQCHAEQQIDTLSFRCQDERIFSLNFPFSLPLHFKLFISFSDFCCYIYFYFVDTFSFTFTFSEFCLRYSAPLGCHGKRKG